MGICDSKQAFLYKVIHTGMYIIRFMGVVTRLHTGVRDADMNL